MGRDKSTVRAAAIAISVAASPLVLTVAVMVFLGRRLLTDPDLFVMYHVADALYLIGAFALIVSAMFCDKAGWDRTSLGTLIASGIFVSLALTDQYVLHFRFDTDGFGGYLVTHANWQRTFVKKNSLGYWEREFSEVQKVPLMITVAGKSFTFGSGIKGMQYRFSAVLQTLLRQRGGR